MVKTKIGPSPVHGIGIFAAQFIPKGTVMWKFVPGFDTALSEDEFRALPPLAQAAVKNYCYKSTTSGRYIVCLDDARYYNHSEKPNTAPGPLIDGEGSDIAAWDIQVGEEIFNDYRQTDADFEFKMKNDVRN